ncbi:uncharacterized protein LOC126654802 [Mercurialis annua]|uniref:uncharacterized protein LOC126654802 n=1 Tax=Mercurialis annua TaxID=3986 RepID=UPI00215DFBEC|nr:uncharacterized protein LOC126654802 [Mercurialis annua]
MGNCQAAEAATVVIQHPGNKIERIYWSVSADQIMNSNPGHYVALVVSSPNLKPENDVSTPPLKQLKLLRPDDTLLIGQFYKLISFEDVLKEFAAKKCVRLGKLLKERGGAGLGVELKKKKDLSNKSENCSSHVQVEQEVHRLGSNGGRTSRSGSRGGGGVGRHYGGGGGGQWKPALQSITELGT